MDPEPEELFEQTSIKGVSSFSLNYKRPKEPQNSLSALKFKSYTKTWTKCKQKIDETLSNLRSESLDQVLSFVQSPQPDQSLMSTLCKKTFVRTGLLVGISPAVCSFLEQALSTSSEHDEEETCVISRISSADCQNIKNTLRAVFQGFRQNLKEEFSDNEEYVQGSTLAMEDIQSLPAWYKWVAEKSETEITLVLLLEDCEGMEPRVLSSLCESLSVYAQEIPIVFLIGIGTSSEIVTHTLLRPVLNLLDLQTFIVESDAKMFRRLIEQVFIEWVDVPIQLNQKTINMLGGLFRDYHMSINSTIAMIQYIYLNHCTQSSTGFLIGLVDQDLETVLHGIDLHEISERAVTIADIQSCISESREKLENWMKNRLVGRGILQILHDWFKRTWDINSVTADDKRITDLVGLLRKVETAHKFIAIVQDILALSLDSKSREVLEYASEKVNILKIQKKTALTNPNTVGGLEGIFPGQRPHAADSEYGQVVAKVAETVNNIVSTSFVELSDNIFLAAYSPTFEDIMHPDLLATYRKTLSKMQESSIPPDIAIAFQLYQDSGKMINIADWYNAFEMTISPQGGESNNTEKESPTKGRKGKKRPRDSPEAPEVTEDTPQIKQIRFLRAIGDLAYLGFITSASRKQEHVTKVIY